MSAVQSQVVNGPVSSPIRAALGAYRCTVAAIATGSVVHRPRAKPGCLLHQAREALSPSATHRVQHTVSWLLPPGCLCCDHRALSESHEVIRRPLPRLPPCFVIRGFDTPTRVQSCPTRSITLSSRCARPSPFFWYRLRNLTPGPPPFSSMKFDTCGFRRGSPSRSAGKTIDYQPKNFVIMSIIETGSTQLSLSVTGREVPP